MTQNTDTRPSWDQYGLGLAAAAAVRADCTRSQVGAVLMRPNHTISGTGYNGAPAGEPGCKTDGACPRGRLDYSELPALVPYSEGAGRCIAHHAEANALYHCAEYSLVGYTLYVTREPCTDCRALADRHGLARIVWPEGSLCL